MIEKVLRCFYLTHYFKLLPFVFSLGVILSIYFSDFTIDNQSTFFRYTGLIFFFALISVFSVYFSCKKKSKLFFVDLLFVLLFLYVLFNLLFLGELIIENIILVLAFPLFWFCFLHIFNRNNIWVIFYSIIILSVLESVLSYTQLSKSLFIGSFNNPGPLGGFIAMCFPYILAELYMSIKKRYSLSSVIFLSLCSILLLSVVYVSDSRSALVACLGGGVFFLYLVKKKHIFVSVKKMLLLAILFLIFLFFLRPNSVIGRFLIWKIIFLNFQNIPLWGIGLGNYRLFSMEWQREYFENYSFSENDVMLADVPTYPFNEYLCIIVELGVVGFLLIAYFFYFLFIHIVKGEIRCYAALASTFSVALFSFASYPFHLYPFLLILLINLLVIRLFCVNGLFTARSSKFCSCYIYRILSIVFACLVISYIPRFYYAQKYRNEKKYFSLMNTAELVAVYDEYYLYLNEDAKFIFDYGMHFYKIRKFDSCIYMLNNNLVLQMNPMSLVFIGDSYKELQMYDKAREYYLRFHYLVPNRFYPLYLLMKLYEKEGQFNEALKIAEQILNKDIKIHSSEIDFIVNEAKKISIKYS